MISSLYDRYFQKSKVFLFPLLELPRQPIVLKFKTFLIWEDIIRGEDYKLICLVDECDENFYNYEINYINNCPYLIEKHNGENGKVIYVFNLSKYKQDWIYFLKGKYSYLSETCKLLISRYYGPKSNEYKYIKTFLYPSEYFELYSKLLDVDVNLLKEVGELCDKYDINQEFLKFTPINLEIT